MAREQHPVPQNITSFEFRLIGDMTIRQFGFLASGTISAYIFWQLPLPTLVRIPLSFLLAFLGVAFAFLPLEERPLHRWLWAFLKSVYSPTQYVFQKSEKAPLYLLPDFPSKTPKIVPIFQVAESRRKLEEYLKTLPKSLPTTLDTQEEDSLKKINALLGTLAALQPLRPTVPSVPFRSPRPSRVGLPGKVILPESPLGSLKPFSGKKLAFGEGGRLLFEEEGKNIPTLPFSPGKIASRADLLVEEIKKLKQAIAEMQKKRPPSQAPTTEVANYQAHLTDLEKQLEQTEKEKESLMRAMLNLQKAISQKPKGVIPKEVLEKSQAVKIISPSVAKELGLPKLTDVPNIITGVVQKPGGGFLANILVEVKDEKDNSVRAFKTNKLGQFVSATPLENGTYNIEFEDPRHEFIFDIIEVKFDGSVLPPLAIYAKGPAELEKETIRQSLFGEPN